MKKIFISLLICLPFFVKGQENYYVFHENKKTGVINQDGKQIIPAKYDFIDICEDYFICEQNNKSGVIDYNNQTIVPFKYGEISFNKHFIVSKNHKKGVVNSRNKFIIPLVYADIKICNDGNFIVVKNEKYGLLDSTGKVILDFKYEELGYDNIAYSENRIVFKENGKYGYLDEFANVVITPSYKRASAFKNGKAIVNYSGIIDINGNCILEPDKFYHLFDCDGIYYAWHKEQRNKCILSSEGEILFDGLVSDFLAIKNGTAVISQGKKYGLIDTTGKIIIPTIYDGISEMGDNGLIPVLKNGKWGFVNQNNETIIDFKFTGMMRPFSDGLAAFYSDKFSTQGRYTSQKAGYISTEGEIVIFPQFYEAGDFKNGRAIVKTQTERLLINTKGEIIYNFLKDFNGIEMMISE